MATAASSSSSSSSLPSAWETSRRFTRTLEAQLDAKLTAYSSLASRIARSEASPSHNHTGSHSNGDYTAINFEGGGIGGSEAREEEEDRSRLESEIEDALAQLSRSHTRLSTILDDPNVPPSSSQMHALQRHQEVLADFERDYRRSKTNVRHALDRKFLVGRVRNDIDAYKAQHASTADALLAERGRIDSSHRMLDGTLEQAYATRSDFADQRESLASMSSRLGAAAQQIPGLDGLLNLISRRRRRDSLIMSCLIAFCTLVILAYVFR